MCVCVCVCVGVCLCTHVYFPTGLHVEQQVLAVLPGLLGLLLQVPPLGGREQSALLAVRQEVRQVGLQLIQGLVPLRRTLGAHLDQQGETGETGVGRGVRGRKGNTEKGGRQGEEWGSGMYV